jgi:hypothetical protein
MRVLAAADRPGAGRPAAKVQGGKCRDLGAWSWRAVGVDGWLPGSLVDGQDRGADPLVGGQADREADAALAQVVDEGGGRPGAVSTDQDRLVAGGAGQLREREVKDLDVVGGGIGPGVAGPQHPGQCLPGAIAAVQVAGQRMNP